MQTQAALQGSAGPASWLGGGTPTVNKKVSITKIGARDVLR